MSHDLLFKLLLIGDSNVGKICLLRRFTENESDAPKKSTIGVDFKIKTVELEGKKIKLQIWDTAGQERFHTITTSYYRGAVGIFVVYDITNLKSFENVTNWLRNIAEHASEHAEKMILGNNCEKVTERQVSVEQAQHLAIEHACQFLEVSAKEDINVEKAFLSLTSAILNKYRQTIGPTKIKPSFCKT